MALGGTRRVNGADDVNEAQTSCYNKISSGRKEMAMAVRGIK